MAPSPRRTPVLPNDEKLDRLKRACQKARVTFDGLVNDARAGRVQFHDTPNGLAVTTLTLSDTFRVCYIIVAGGNLKGIQELDLVIEKFARENKCNLIHTMGRLGFEKLARNYGKTRGYRAIGIFYEKVLV